MVGPGEVDDDLQPEVIEECSKYGEVSNCLIFEVHMRCIHVLSLVLSLVPMYNVSCIWRSTMQFVCEATPLNLV